MAHFFDHHNASLTEGGALAVVVEDSPETPHQTRDNTDFPRPLRKSEARLRLACPCGKAIEPIVNGQRRGWIGGKSTTAGASLRRPAQPQDVGVRLKVDRLALIGSFGRAGGVNRTTCQLPR